MLESTNIEKKIYEYQIKLKCKQRIFNILQITWKLTMVSCSQNFLTKALLTMLLVTTMAMTLSGWMVSFSYKPSFIIQSLNFLSGLFCSSNVFLMLMIVNIDLNLRNDISSLVFIYYSFHYFAKLFLLILGILDLHGILGMGVPYPALVLLLPPHAPHHPRGLLLLLHLVSPLHLTLPCTRPCSS